MFGFLGFIVFGLVAGAIARTLVLFAATRVV